MSSIRPLPAHPNIAFDRKRAKDLLKQLRSGDPVALQRSGEHVARSAHRTNEMWTLADAQRIVAREYGLPSWPRLVAYLADLERHRHAPRHNRVDQPVEQLESVADYVLRRHSHRDEFPGTSFKTGGGETDGGGCIVGSGDCNHVVRVGGHEV